MQFVAALLPVVIYIAAVYFLDNFSLISVKRLLLLAVLGWTIVIAAGMILQKRRKAVR